MNVVWVEYFEWHYPSDHKASVKLAKEIYLKLI